MAKEFWLSEEATGYLDSVLSPGREGRIRKGIGDFLLRQQAIPEEGEILDVAAGPSSGLIFGGSVGRVTAVDISPLLLAKNPVDSERKIIMDVANESFPSGWHGRFNLAVAVFFHRYLTRNESFHVASQAREALAPGEKFIIIDMPAIGKPQMGITMGEERVFNTDEEVDILWEAGYHGVSVHQVTFSAPYYKWPPPDLHEVVGYT